MFENKMVLLSIGDSFFAGEIKNNRILNAVNINFGAEVIKNEKIFDKAQAAYIISKLLARYDSNSKIIIRNSNGILFRSLTVNNLATDEIESYVKYNVSEIFPFDVSDRKLKSEYENGKLYTYAIYSDDFNFIAETIGNLKFKEKFLTVFPSEMRMFFNTQKVSNAVAINILQNSYELVFNKNGEVVYYEKFRKTTDNDFINFLKSKIRLIFGDENSKILILNEFNSENNTFNILSENFGEEKLRNIRFNYEDYLR